MLPNKRRTTIIVRLNKYIFIKKTVSFCSFYKIAASDREVVNIIKDGTGIGISLDGGYDSPAGHKPLIIKKIFMGKMIRENLFSWIQNFNIFFLLIIGGAAEKLSNLRAGDEILEINGLSTERQTRIDVWNMIKKLPQGETVQLKIKRKWKKKYI